MITNAKAPAHSTYSLRLRTNYTFSWSLVAAYLSAALLRTFFPFSPSCRVAKWTRLLAVPARFRLARQWFTYCLHTKREYLLQHGKKEVIQIKVHVGKAVAQIRKQIIGWIVQGEGNRIKAQV